MCRRSCLDNGGIQNSGLQAITLIENWPIRVNACFYEKVIKVKADVAAPP